MYRHELTDDDDYDHNAVEPPAAQPQPSQPHAEQHTSATSTPHAFTSASATSSPQPISSIWHRDDTSSTADTTSTTATTSQQLAEAEDLLHHPKPSIPNTVEAAMPVCFYVFMVSYSKKNLCWQIKQINILLLLGTYKCYSIHHHQTPMASHSQCLRFWYTTYMNNWSFFCCFFF